MRLVLIGDYVRKDYEPLVRERLAGRIELRAPEENCRDSRVVLAHLDPWVFAHAPDLVHINCGLHDLKREFGQTRHQVPIDEYQSNLRAILGRLLDAGIAVIWATTTPVNEVWHHREKGFDRFEADVETYNAAASAIARELGLPINDLYAAVMAGGRDRLLLSDGIHYNQDGRAVQARAVAEAVLGWLDAR